MFEVGPLVIRPAIHKPIHFININWFIWNVRTYLNPRIPSVKSQTKIIFFKAPNKSDEISCNAVPAAEVMNRRER